MRNGVKIKSSLLGLVLMCLLYTPAWATRYWVATTGSDAISCATAAGATDPGAGHYKLTAAGGAACLTVAGDRLTIKAGTYSNAEIWGISVKQGVAGNPTIIEGEGIANTKLLLNDHALTIGFSDATVPSYITIRLMELDGINMTGKTDCVRFAYNNDAVTGTGNLVEDVLIHNCGDNGVFTTISINATRLNRVESHHNGRIPPGGPSGHGFYLEGNNVIVENGSFHDMTNTQSGGGQCFASPAGIRADNCIMRNNIFYNNTFGATFDGNNIQAYNNIFHDSLGDALTFGFESATSGNLIANNTFYHNAGYAIIVGIFAASNNATLINNLIANTNTINILSGSTGTVQTTNVTGAPATITNCTVSTSDFHLKAGAPCIDAGTTVSAVTTDFDGNARPMGAAYDVGAYEFGSSPPPPSPPAAPTGLRIQ